MNLGSMQTDVFNRLAETTGSSARWSVQDVTDAINEGLEELSDATEFYERYATITLRPNSNYYDLRTIVPDTILRVTAVYNPSNFTWLLPADVRDLDYKTARQWELVQGEPLRYFIRGLWWMGVYPATSAATSTMRVYYRSLHPALTDATQVPEQLPEDYHNALVDYAVYTLLADDVEITQAAQFWNRYKGTEAALAAKSFPGSRVSRPRMAGMGFNK